MKSKRDLKWKKQKNQLMNIQKLLLLKMKWLLKY